MKTTQNQHTVYSLSIKTGLIFGLALVLIQGTVSMSNARDDDRLAELIQTALEQNNDILAAESRLTEATEKIRQAGTLPDPKLGMEYFLRPIETRTGPQEASVSLSQSIPWLGRLSLERELKQNESEIVRAAVTSTHLGVIRKVKETYIEYGYLGQAKKITTQILELMNYLEGIARTNYTNGKASYTDVLKIQIEIAKLENRQSALDDNTIPVRVRLNTLLGADRNMARRQPEALPEISFALSEDEIYTQARQNSPTILAGHHKVTRNHTSLDIADQGFYPDITLSVKTIFTGEAEFGNPPDSGDNPVVAGVSFNLPVFFDRRNGAIAEKQASVRTARNELEQALKTLDADIESALFHYREAERLLNLYRDNLIPKVRQELDVALEAFQGGQYSILELIDSEKNWLSFELALIRALADKAIQVARLEELSGTTLADWDQKS